MDLNYENFLVTRPLWASFEESRDGIPMMWGSRIAEETAAYADMLNIGNLSTRKPLNNTIIEGFQYDSKLESLWRNPYSKLHALRKCLSVLTPDFSITPSMNKAQVLYNTYRNRWMGCFLQQFSIDSIPSVSWAKPWTYDICIQGIPKGNPIAVSTIGSIDTEMFLEGYDYFMDNIKPAYVICYGKPIIGMRGRLIRFDYEDAFMPNRNGEQMRLFPLSRLEIYDKEE